MRQLLFLLWAFLSTELLECLAVLLLQKKKKFVFICLIANITNPIVNLVLLLVSVTGSYPLYYGAAILLEAAALVYEAFLYRYMGGVTVKRAFLISAVCNAASLFIGSGLVLLVKILIP